MRTITALFLIVFISCQSNLDIDPVDRFNIITKYDTIRTQITDSLIVSVTDTLFVQDTIFLKVYDTIKVTDTTRVIENIKVYDTIVTTETVKVYDTILTYSPTRLAVRFLYHNDTQQVLKLDSIFLNGPEKVLWEAEGYTVDAVQFELVK